LGAAVTKVLVVHPGVHFSVADVYNGVVKGLRENGCDVGVLNLDDRIEFYSRAYIALGDDEEAGYRKALTDTAAMEMAAQGIEATLYEWWPDIVIIVSGFFIPPKLWGVLRRRPHHVVYWCTESPYEDDRQATPARYADTVILNDPSSLDWYRGEVNERTFYMPHSYDPDVHHPGGADPDLVCDFGFVGTGFPSRVDWFEQVDWAGIDAKFGGNWQEVDDDSPLARLLLHPRGACIDNVDTARLYRSCKASLNLYRKEHSDNAHAAGWAMGPREVELAACGTFFFREARPEGDELFPMLPIVDEPHGFGDVLRWWLAHDSERKSAAEAARAAIADRTFRNHTAEMLRLVEGAGRKIAA
jgi:spore maturation protein CgeB